MKIFSYQILHFIILNNFKNTGRTQGKQREHTGKTQRTHRENTENTQGKHRDYAIITLGMKVPLKYC